MSDKKQIKQLGEYSSNQDITIDMDPISVTAKPSVLTSREDYKRLGYYANEFRKGNIQLEQIPYRYRSHLKPTREEQQKAFSNLVQTEAKERERYNNSSTGRVTNLLGNVATGVLAIPALSITAGAGASQVAEAMSAPELLTSYKVPFAAKLATDFLGGAALGEATNAVARKSGYANFGDAVHDTMFPDRANINTFGDNAIASTFEFINPGYILGGVGANYLGHAAPKMFNNVLNGAKPFVKKAIKKITLLPRLHSALTRAELRSAQLLEQLKKYRNIEHLLWKRQQRQRLPPQAKKVYTTERPFYSNDVNTIQQLLTGYSVERISPTEIAIAKSDILQPDIKLPLGTSIPLARVGRKPTILRYSTAKGGLPEVIIPESFSLSDYRNLPNEVYYMLPDDVLSAIRQESIDAARAYNPRNLPGIKEFGSLSTVKEGYLPHISTDADAITSRAFYDAHIKGKVPLYSMQKTRNGYTHTYKNHRGVMQPLDIVVIENGSNGLADPNSEIAIQLFAKQHPIEYAEAVQNAALTGKQIRIPYTSEQLIEGINPIEDTVFDAFLSEKSKHVGRVPLLMERVDPEILQNVITKKGQIMFGKNYTPLRGIDYSDYEANLKFLAEIGYQGEHLQNLARDPERMKLVGEEYFQYLSSVARGESNVESLADWIKKSTIWDPSIQGGVGHGSGKNSAILTNSRYGPYYSSMQVDLNPYLEGKSLDEVIEFSKILTGEKNLPSDVGTKLSDILGVSITNMDDINNYFLKLYRDSPTYLQIKDKINAVAEHYPYFQPAGNWFRGFYATPNTGLRFNSDKHRFPFEPMTNTFMRMRKPNGDNDIVRINPHYSRSKIRPSHHINSPYEVTYEKREDVRSRMRDLDRKRWRSDYYQRVYNDAIDNLHALITKIVLSGIGLGGAASVGYGILGFGQNKKVKQKLNTREDRESFRDSLYNTKKIIN